MSAMSRYLEILLASLSSKKKNINLIFTKTEKTFLSNTVKILYNIFMCKL